MVNEGKVVGTTASQIKSIMVKEIWKLKEATPDAWERAVFRVVTGHEREDVDWEFEDNQAGYFTWIKTFDALITELIDDGYVSVEERDGGRILKARPVDPASDWSPETHPNQR